MSDAAERYRRFRTSGGVADLSSRCKLRLTGADRVRFLNGQVTANVTKLAPGHALPACITTARGKLCGEALLHATADGLLIDADPSLRETLPARLERYIISDDVAVEDASADLHLIHLLGALAPGADLTSRCVATDRVRRFGHDGWDLLLAPEVFPEVWPQLVSSSLEIDPGLQELVRIEAGVPRWGAELNEDTLPPEAGLDATHIDYHKGCYIGQEVISRLKSVGHINRQLTGFVSPAGMLAPGTALFAPGDDARPIGIITSSAFSFALEKPIALGYLRRGAGFPEVIARAADPAGSDTVAAPHPLPFVS